MCDVNTNRHIAVFNNKYAKCLGIHPNRPYFLNIDLNSNETRLEINKKETVPFQVDIEIDELFTIYTEEEFMQLVSDRLNTDKLEFICTDIDLYPSFQVIDRETGEEIGLLDLRVTGHVYISYISIHEEYRRRGYATAIINHVVDVFGNSEIRADIEETKIADIFWTSYCKKNLDDYYLKHSDLIINKSS